MKKLLIVGAGKEQVIAIQKAREMGYYVICTDFSDKAPGITFAHKFFQISTDDIVGNLKIAKENAIDGVLTICSETAVPVVGKICDEMNLSGLSYETGIQATNKGDMRLAMEKGNVAMPARKLIGSLEEAYLFCEEVKGPWVLKPSDSSGQRGTNCIYFKEEIEKAFYDAKENASDQMVLIDQFIAGQEINVCAIVKDSKITILSLADRDTLGGEHFGIAVLHSLPPSINESQMISVKELAINAIKAIGLTNGIAYPQIIVTEEGPKLIEIAARMPGGYNREMAMYSSGIDMVEAQILISMNEPFGLEEIRSSERYSAVSVKLFTELDFKDVDKVDTIAGLEMVRELPNVKGCYFELEKKQPLPKLTFSGGRFGAVITVGGSKEETMRLNEKCSQMIIIS